jgi:WD40 repeat protein
MARRLIPLSAYEQLSSDGRSGLAVAIATKADATLAALSAEQQAIARRILLRLVQFGEGRADTRRQQPFEALRSAGDDVALFTQTLNHLADNRLLTLSSAEGRVGDATTQPDNRVPERDDSTPPAIRASLVDIAHEALIAGWPTLHGWLTERREAEQIRRRLEDQAASWIRMGSTRGGLLDSVELLEAERWLESLQAADLGCSEALPKLVQASRAAIEEAAQAEEAARRREVMAAQALATAHERRIAVQARSAKQLRWLATILTLVALGALGAAWYALRQARVALSRQLAAQSIAMLDDQPDLALLLGLEAFNTADITAARNSLIAARQRSPYLETFLRGHKSDLKSVAFSPDGSLIATSGCGATDARRRCRQGIVNLWSATTHRLEGAPLSGHVGSIDGMAFSPDGQLIATAGCSTLDANGACIAGEIRLWNVRARQSSAIFSTGERGGITSLVFSPLGTALAAAGRDGTVSLWELSLGAQSRIILAGHAGIVSTIAFSPDGKRLVSGGEDKSVRVWDVALHKAIAQLPAVHLKHVRSVAFSPDGSIFASGDLAGQIRLWDAYTLTELGDPLIVQGEQIWSLAFSPDSRLLASGGRSKRITLWQVATRQPIGPELIGHQDSVTSLAFSHDGTHLVSGSMDTTAILWNIGAQPPLPDPGGPVRSVVFSSDGSTLIAGSCGQLDDSGNCTQGEIRRWDSASYTQIGAPIPAHSNTVTAMALSKDGRLLATGSEDATIIVWNTLTWQPLGPPLTGHSRRIESLAFMPDGTLLASGSCSGSALESCRQGEIRLWQVNQLTASGPPIHAHTDFVTSVAFSHDGAMLASGSLDRTIMVWNTSTGRQIGETLRGHTNRVYSVAFNQDSTILASAGADQDVILWDVAAHWKQGNPLTGHTDSVYSLAFSPDGATLASAGADGAVLLWDVATQQRIGIPIRGHPASIFSIAFSSDGRRLATAGEDQTVIPWDVGFLGQDDAAKWRDIVCAIVARDLTDDEWARFGSGARATGANCKAMEDER